MEGRNLIKFLLGFFGRDFDKLRQPGGRHYPSGELNQQYSLMFIIFFVLVFPFLFLLALLPLWDQVGEWSIVKSIDGFLVPGIEGLPPGPPRGFSQRRFLIGGSATLVLLFIVQWIVVLSSRHLRFLALHIYDLLRAKFFVFLLTVGAGFVLAWYLAFFVTDLSVIDSYRPGRLYGRLIVFLPVLTLFVGQLTAVVILGFIRDLTHLPRAYRSWKNKKAGGVS